MGERRIKDALCGMRVSSSKVRLRLERLAELFLMAIGIICWTVGVTGAGIRRGDWGATGGGSGEGATWAEEEEADAEICDVWGSLGPLRNGLKSQAGASFDARLPFEMVIRPGVLLEEVDLSDCTERMEGAGDVVGSLKDIAALRRPPGGPSGGSSFMIVLGLSSIVAIRDAAIEFR